VVQRTREIAESGAPHGASYALWTSAPNVPFCTASELNTTDLMVLFCRPVVTAPAFVKRDGTVPADAWPPDLIRLGELEVRLGDGVIEEVASAALAAGRLPQRWIMSYPLVIRLMIAMTLMPDGRTARHCRGWRG